MKHGKHMWRWTAAGAGVLALSGVGTAAATTEPPPDTADDITMTTEDTIGDEIVVDTSEPMAGAGPSDCPAVTVEATEPGLAEDTAPVETADDLAVPTTEAADDLMVPTTEVGATTEATDGSTIDTIEPSATTEAIITGPFVQIAETDEYGEILVDSECRSLYGFKQDVDGEPTCVDDCALNWPPLFVPDGEVPPLADELDPTPFSVVDHVDGPMLKVGDWPLYYFAGDVVPGDTNGQGVGDVWYLVAPDGTLLDLDEEEAPSTDMVTETTSEFVTETTSG